MLNFIRSDLAQLAPYLTHADEGADSLDKLDANESPYDLPLELKEKLTWVYQQQINTNRYPDLTHSELKEAIADYVNESASTTAIAPNNISVGNGSDELIRSLLIATCLGGEGSVLVAQPTFSVYAIMSQTLGIPVHSIERQENFSLNLEEAQTIVKRENQPPVRVVFVVHPNSPTANALTPAELDWLRSLPEQILVVVDEAYFEFSQTTVVAELAQHPNWVILRTFSKAFRLATHRVGYAIAHPELIAALEKIRLPYNLTGFSQAAALAALRERRLILPAIATILSERERLYRALCEHTSLQVWPSDANFIYLRSTTGTPLNQMREALVAEGTLVRCTGGGIRVTVGSPEENTRTIKRFLSLLNTGF
ncbi:MAG: histidinol-phosphate transaminase [Cyanophyceae cyanobacterium]